MAGHGQRRNHFRSRLGPSENEADPVEMGPVSRYSKEH